MEQFDVAQLDRQKLVSLIMSDASILDEIRESAYDTPNLPWTTIDIHSLVFECLNIDLDLDDTCLFGQLLIRFNAEQMIALTAFSMAS